MAQRRMFSKEITNSSEFLMMAPSAQTLYFHFGMNADDDGFCEVFTVMRMTESKPDDLRALVERGLIFAVDGKVCIVKDWHTNNYIQADRYSPSKYLSDPHYAEIYATVMQEKVEAIGRYSRMYTKRIQAVSKTDTQVRLGKVRKGKKNTAAAKAAAPAIEEKPYNPEETRQRWFDGEDLAYQLLAWFFDAKKLWPKLTTKEKLQHAGARYLRTARRIVRAGWSQAEVLKAYQRIPEKLAGEFTLETIEKYLTK